MKKHFYFAIIILGCCFISCKGKKVAEPISKESSKDSSYDVLVFSKTAGYRHESIGAGRAALKHLSKANGYKVQFSEDASIFQDKPLEEIEVIVFLSTTGDILNEDQQGAMERFIQSGKGFVGIHAATDTEYEWPWYNKLVGAYFADHPPGVHEATLHKLNPHQSTNHLPTNWTRTDEWYNFKSVNPETVKILNLDESSYEGGNMGEQHPIAWYHEFDGGRAWYTAGGHTIESFSEPAFITHVLAGIKYAAGR